MPDRRMPDALFRTEGAKFDIFLADAKGEETDVSVDFAKGVVLSVLFACVCTFGVLAHVDGFPLLALSILPFVAVAAYATTKPRLAPVVLPLLIFFMTLVGPTNPMHYDIVAFCNAAFAFPVQHHDVIAHDMKMLELHFRRFDKIVVYAPDCLAQHLS